VKNYEDEAKWNTRYQESLFCPRCKVNNERHMGVPVVGVGGISAHGRRIRPTYYLSHEEAVRLRKYLTDGRPLEQVANQRQIDGKSLVVGTGNYRDVPFTRRANVNGMDKVIQFGPLVMFNETPFPESWSPIGGGVDMTAMATMFNQVRNLQTKITRLDEQIDAARVKGESDAKISAMFAARKALVEQVNVLTQQISTAA
jgi:hypothetical protein